MPPLQLLPFLFNEEEIQSLLPPCLQNHEDKCNSTVMRHDDKMFCSYVILEYRRFFFIILNATQKATNITMNQDNILTPPPLPRRLCLSAIQHNFTSEYKHINQPTKQSTIIKLTVVVAILKLI